LSNLSLADLGWSDFFASQLPVQPSYRAARVTDVHRGRLDLLGPEEQLALIPSQTTGVYAVGDWIYHDGQCAHQVVGRKTSIDRGAAG